MAGDPPSTIDVPAVIRTRDRLKYAFNAVFFAFEDAVKATKNYFDSLDPVMSQAIALPSNLPTSIPTALEQAREGDRERNKHNGLKRKRSSAATPDFDPENLPPKRAMTPFFLFLNQNRQRIKLDLQSRDEPATMTKISEEATRRWKALSLDEKTKYDREYQFNFDSYKRQLREWKTNAKPAGKVQESPVRGPETVVDKASQPAVPIEMVSTPLTGGKKKKKKKKKKKHGDGKEMDRSHKTRSEKRNESKRRHSLDPLTTPTPAAKMSSSVTPVDLSGADKSGKKMKVRHGDKEKARTPKSEKKEKRKREKEEMFQLGEGHDFGVVKSSKTLAMVAPSPRRDTSS
ncbi:hypothetical protein KEM54_000272 [Ascosphaera aggregata]|nr:hypothetical protein KEM54_000272 [Ascosphaera aggregata]